MCQGYNTTVDKTDTASDTIRNTLRKPLKVRYAGVRRAGNRKPSPYQGVQAILTGKVTLWLIWKRDGRRQLLGKRRYRYKSPNVGKILQNLRS